MGRSIHVNPELTHRKQAERLIRVDSRSQFLMFMRNQWDILDRSPPFTPSEMLKLVCTHSAVGCASALLEGKTRLALDVNMMWEDGLSPMYLAAKNLSSGLVELLLQHGANHNSCHDNCGRDVIPLVVALESLRDHQYVLDWTPEKSIYKLIYILCFPELKEPLKTINLLASKTENIEEICFDFVEKGEVVQVVALLMTAWDRLVGQFTVEASPIGKHIWGHIEAVTNRELELLVACTPSCKCLQDLKKKKINLLSQWKLLKTLEKGRDVIEKYRNSFSPEITPKYYIPNRVASLLTYAGFVLHPDDVYSDDIKCLLPRLEKIYKDRLNEEIEEKINSATTTAKKTIALPTSYNPYRSSSLVRRFHTGCNLNNLESPVTRMPRLIQGSMPSLPKLSRPVNVCTFLILTVKKCIK